MVALAATVGVGSGALTSAAGSPPANPRKALCNTLLDPNEANHAMGEAEPVDAGPITFFDHVLRCPYGGFTEGPPDSSHALLLEFAPFTTYRDSGEFQRVPQQHLLRQPEGVHRLDGFRGNPAIVWELKHPPLQALSLAFVLHYESEKLIRVSAWTRP